MSSITAADLKLGGRLVAACDAVGAGHLRRAAGIFNEIADDLNNEAEATTGLLAPDHEPSAQGLEGNLPCEDDWSAPLPAAAAAVEKPALASGSVPTADLQMCARNVHSYGAPDPTTGWRTCALCGNVNVAPPGDGPIDIGMRG